jgi:hypothetical protein
METHVSIKDEDFKSLQDAILKKGPMIQANIPSRAPVPALPDVAPVALPAQPAFLSYAIEGHVINVPLDSAGAAITLFYTLLALVWGKDKKVAKILKQFDFKFFDANKNQIYPKAKKRAGK